MTFSIPITCGPSNDTSLPDILMVLGTCFILYLFIATEPTDMHTAETHVSVTAVFQAGTDFIALQSYE